MNSNPPNTKDALAVTEETREIDFKASFNPDQGGEWVELIKDIVAMANSGGGNILIGLNNNGSPVLLQDPNTRQADPAEFVDKIYKFTSRHFDKFTIKHIIKDGITITQISIFGTDDLIIFTHPGSYTIPSGKTKNAFAQGTVYFRHGAKSEPGTSEDLQRFFNLKLESVRRAWMDGIARVVEAPPGSQVMVLPSEVRHTTDGSGAPIHLVDDPNAPHAYAIPVDQSHPYRLIDLVKQFKIQSNSFPGLTRHHLICIRQVYDTDHNTVFCHKQKHASPQYSEKFLDWLVNESELNPQFFQNAYAQYSPLKRLSAEAVQ